MSKLYSMKSNIGGLSKKGREQLGLVLKASGETIEVGDVAKTLSIPSQKATQLLSGWCKRGWISRVRRGIYIQVPIQSTTPLVMVDEPWAVAQKLFAPCYVGGWSAAEHWDFTEQIFNSTLVITSQKVHRRNLEMHGVKFLLKTTNKNRFFGLEKIWKGKVKVEVSDPTKTIVDCLNDPAIAGGIRMTADYFKAYLKSKHKDLNLLVSYAEKQGNSAIFKRLGFILETKFPSEKNLILVCKKSIKSGYSQLDPSIVGTELLTNWNLWLPKNWKSGIPE